ncbi:hypothetical protein BJ878DRAFT_330868 [Calycina marina]|uniref:Swiss Army Knife RNA repair protein HAD domain-containing protein n=1 Tax=Calycina marina TaxID=1763456 RepID=A0A9P8CG41_9HELO|nr:hypothetical protein BJ878DRAFT_330868 [Calycina marina]
MAAYTLTALNRWSVADKQLPPIDTIKTIHVYDFDNTLFNSPLPNAKLWNGPTLGFLQTQDTFATGGWWHDARILGATGDGVEIEEKRGWAGWWNEKIAELVQLSMQQKDVLTILLTGRGETNFSELLKKMVASKGLGFDLIALKPVVGPNHERINNTMHFKQLFLDVVVGTYRDATELRIYEDRIGHVKKFREYFTAYNKELQGNGGAVPTRSPIIAEVIQVADGATLLDPVVEAAAVQRIINDHNAAVDSGNARRRMTIKKTLFYTGYLISATDTEKLLTLANIPAAMPDTDIKFLANNILITPRPCPQSILETVGGLGSKTTWKVTGTAVFENRIWAASVEPIPTNAQYYTENPSPFVVLALRKGAKPIDAGKIQNWQPVSHDKEYIFETTVGERVLLRIEDEVSNQTEYESLFPNKALKRKYGQNDETPNSRQASGSYSNGQARGGSQPQNQNVGRGSGRGSGRGNAYQRGGRGGRGSNGNGRGRGRGGYGYRSLDDVGERQTYNANTPAAYNPTVAYEDFPPLQKQHLTPAQLIEQQFKQFNNFQQAQQHARVGGNNQGANSGELQYF